MLQIRLTVKMAEEMKVVNLGNPEEPSFSYDDWYLHVVKISRKKVYIFMHVKTRLAIAVPKHEIGRIKNLFSHFSVQLAYILKKLNNPAYDLIIRESSLAFTQPMKQFAFTKTKTKSLIRYVSEFSWMLKYKMEAHSSAANDVKDVVSQAVCHGVSLSWLSHLMKDPDSPRDYASPKELLARYFV